MTCTKTGTKNDLFLNCRRKMKELSKKELSNVAPASVASAVEAGFSVIIDTYIIQFLFGFAYVYIYTKQVLRSTILSSTILLVFFDNSRIGRF